MGKCIVCGKETDHTVRINSDNGFSQSSVNNYLCSNFNCRQYRCIKDKTFIVINKKLYYVFNASIGIYTDLEEVRNKNHLDYILNENYYELLNLLDW
jgi:hypothetical protein